MAVTPRAWTAGHYTLDLDGMEAGALKSFSGGGASAEVVQSAAGAGPAAMKSLGPISYNDIVVTFGPGMSKGLLDWITAASQGIHHAKNGAVEMLDNQGKEQRRLEWQRGLLTQISIPALDAASKDAFAMTIKITPESAKFVPRGGASHPAIKAQKPVTEANFQVRIDGLEEGCQSVSRVEPISLVSHVVRETVGHEKDYSLSIAQSHPSNIVLTLREGKAKGFRDWFQAFVIDGKNSPDHEKEGSIEIDRFQFVLSHLGIFKMTQSSLANKRDSVALVQVEMYCQSITFSAT